MNRSRTQPNGDIREESPQKKIKRLTQELSNTQRELQLSAQIRNQLEKIRSTSAEIKDITHKLLYDVRHISDAELRGLQKRETEKKAELKKLELRLEMLREIEANECGLNVKLLSYKKCNKKNALLINNKEVFIDNSEDTDETDVDTSEYESTETHIRSRHSSQATETHTVDSWRTLDMEGELKDLKAYRTGRKRLIPERFESFPNRSSKRRSNGMTETND